MSSLFSSLLVVYVSPCRRLRKKALIRRLFQLHGARSLLRTHSLKLPALVTISPVPEVLRKSRQCEGLMCARTMIAMSIFDAKESKSRANQTHYKEEEVLLRI